MSTVFRLLSRRDDWRYRSILRLKRWVFWRPYLYGMISPFSLHGEEEMSKKMIQICAFMVVIILLVQVRTSNPHALRKSKDIERSHADRLLHVRVTSRSENSLPWFFILLDSLEAPHMASSWTNLETETRLIGESRMEEDRKIKKDDFNDLLVIQREMLLENRRLRLLTAWLIVLTATLICTSIATVLGIR